MTNYPIQMEIEVAWGEMDSFGHVNNIIFLRYFESVRILYFNAMGMPFPKAGQAIPGPILANARCDFRSPITFPDKLTVQVGCSRVGKSSYTLAYRILSQAQSEIVADGETVVVYVGHATGKSMPLSAEMLAKIELLEGRSVT